MWLTEKQLERFTGRKRPTAQARVLREAGIPHHLVAGRPMVLKENIKNQTKPKGRLVLA
jgi:hypothetical protein